MATVRPDATASPRPGSRGYLKWYWTRGPGLARWRGSPHPWTTLRRHLGRVIDDKTPNVIDRITSAWFAEVFGYPPSARGGKNPTGRG